MRIWKIEDEDEDDEDEDEEETQATGSIEQD